MKRGTIANKKTAFLADLLDVELLHAVGVLESLWHWTADQCPTGGLEGASDRVIATGVRWHGDASQLVNSLRKAGWLDPHDFHRYVVHDWVDHADGSVHKYLANAGRLFWNGRMPSLEGLHSSQRAEAEVRLRAAISAWSAAAGSFPGGSEEPPRKFPGGSVESPRVAVAVAVNGTTTTPPTPFQAALPLIATAPAPKVEPRATAEQIQALRENCSLLAELDRKANGAEARDTDWWQVHVTSGRVSGKNTNIRGKLIDETMSKKHAVRSLVDSRTALTRLQSQLHLSSAEISAIDSHARRTA